MACGGDECFELGNLAKTEILLNQCRYSHSRERRLNLRFFGKSRNDLPHNHAAAV